MEPRGGCAASGQTLVSGFPQVLPTLRAGSFRGQALSRIQINRRTWTDSADFNHSPRFPVNDTYASN